MRCPLDNACDRCEKPRTWKRSNYIFLPVDMTLFDFIIGDGHYLIRRKPVTDPSA